MSPFRLWVKISGRTLLCMQAINLYTLYRHEGRFEVFAIVVVLTLLLSVLIGLAVVLLQQERRAAVLRPATIEPSTQTEWEWAEHCPRQAEFQRRMNELATSK
ncbi:hypothetical protein [Ralstonia phage phiRSL1]|uniref:Uncharacterized protein n=1 Tax=Ralstonia phage phiRSL1 TaxID=1980924 RepID=B2ZYF0_9CAUD|nr:hypothetical protein RSL1_ORF305 [Ralstonia phage phiRSL1]BAG41751.1 hypothetical protein [Ralstonia phage phiRSL1]